MITWGISANSHNAALAVFDDDKLVFASESERFSGLKNDAHLNRKLVSYAKRFGEPSRVYWYEKPLLKTMRQFSAGQGWNRLENNIEIYLARHEIDAPVSYTGHHHSHAAAGYYTSNFDEACVVVIDAIGEFEATSLWIGEGDKLSKISSIEYPHSVGLFYSAMTQRCGLKPNEEEYILMGMAALGDPNRLVRDLLNDFVELPNDDYQHPYRIKQNLHRGCKWWRPELTSQQDLYDIAAATQKVYEIIFERILQTAISKSSSRNLVLMGGCALNCAANPIAYKYFDQVWIMPAPGDSGSSIGAVLAHKKKRINWTGPYLGHDMGYTTSNEEIVAHLLEHKMCGLARGPAEFGPRALGNRSLIADPRGSEIKVAINQIKHREQFRPFAPAILEEFANQYFKISTESMTYMQYIAPCLESESFPAIVHLDNTSRVQTVNKTDNPQFRALLELWYAKTGCPMLLNTSLNIKGKPMVNDAADAASWTQLHGLPVFN
jgi:carbamoyltransferase